MNPNTNVTGELGAPSAAPDGLNLESDWTAVLADVDSLAASSSAISKPKLEDLATELARGYLDDLRQARAAGETDASDALQALPVLQRIREHAEKMELQRNGGDRLPTIIWNITTAGAVEMQVAKPGEVVADAVEISDAPGQVAPPSVPAIEFPPFVSEDTPQ